jgi:hypothetical protein
MNTPPLNDMTIEEFDVASNHPYECRCELCQRWWAEVGPEDEGDDDADDR